MDFKNQNLIYKYYSQFKEYEIIAELIMIEKHFDKFIANSLIESKDNGFILSWWKMNKKYRKSLSNTFLNYSF